MVCIRCSENVKNISMLMYNQGSITFQSIDLKLPIFLRLASSPTQPPLLSSQTWTNVMTIQRRRLAIFSKIPLQFLCLHTEALPLVEFLPLPNQPATLIPTKNQQISWSQDLADALSDLVDSEMLNNLLPFIYRFQVSTLILLATSLSEHSLQHS